MDVNRQVALSTPEYVSAKEAARLFGVHPDVIRNSPEVKQHRVTVMRPQSVYPVDRIKRFVATHSSSTSPAEIRPEKEALSYNNSGTSEDSGAAADAEPHLPDRDPGESNSDYATRVHRENPEGVYPLKAWSGQTGISVRELERAIESSALSCDPKPKGRNHGLKQVSAAAIASYASAVEAVRRKQIRAPHWWADVRPTHSWGRR